METFGKLSKLVRAAQDREGVLPQGNSWRVSYDVVTDESAEHGSTASAGYIGDTGSGSGMHQDEPDNITTLRDALRCFDYEGHYVEADRYPCIKREDAPTWFSVNFAPDFETGESESRYLHIPGNVTPSSRIRIGRLIGADMTSGVPRTIFG